MGAEETKKVSSRESEGKHEDLRRTKSKTEERKAKRK